MVKHYVKEYTMFWTLDSLAYIHNYQHVKYSFVLQSVIINTKRLVTLLNP